VILGEPFKSRTNAFCLIVHDAIMKRLKNKGLAVDLQILVNKCSKEYWCRMTKKWGVVF
jgi:hypothetical protein